MTDFHTPQPRAGQTINAPATDLGPQPDPMLDESGRRSGGWIWAAGAAIFAIVAVTLYGINNQEPQTASNESAAPQTTGENASPQSAVPAGRGTADAPAEQQAQGQTGKGSGASQNSAAGTQGSQSATTGQGGQGADQQQPKQQ